MRGVILPDWTPAMTAARAVRSVRLDRTVRYALGQGGADPTGAYPDALPGGAGRSGACDCVGFGLWAAGADRYQPGDFPVYGGWINCNSAILDARSKKPAMFQEIPRWEARVGDMVVYPSRFFGLGHGHWGVVVGTVYQLPKKAKWTDRLVIAHCSAGHQKTLGYAISQGDEKIFTRRATVLRPRWYREDA